MSFTHLHLHSEYSLLDGCCRIKDIPRAVKEAGQNAVALTDHGVMYGAIAFYEACVSESVKPIVGCEVYLAPGSRKNRPEPGQSAYSHLVLLCKNEIGYRNLMHLVSLGFTEGFYSKPRIDMELLCEYHEGLICLTGCLAGAIPTALLNGDTEQAENIAFKLFDLFGDDLYLEIQDHGLAEDKLVTERIVELSQTTGIPIVATNDVHYLAKDDSFAQRVLMSVQMGKTVGELSEELFSSNEFYLKTEEEMSELFGELPEAVSITEEIVEKCDLSFSFGERFLPKAKLEPGADADLTLRDLAYAGLEKYASDGRIRFAHHNRDEYTERIEHELNVICDMGFSDYYLIVCDFVCYAKSIGVPVGPGRGSGAGSMIAYLIGITEIDPIEYDLMFEAFLNPERVSMPDFDIDFCARRRGEVIDYVREKYGEQCVARIVAFNTFAAKQALRDVGRALGMSYNDTDTIVKLLEGSNSIKEATENSISLKNVIKNNKDAAQLISVASAIEGMPRNVTIHAAGIVIFDRPLYDHVPLCMSGGEVLTQYDMDVVAKLGLLKFDFLGIRYLTVISDAENAVKKRHPDFDIRSIPEDDKKTYDLIAHEQCSGLFQIESAGMQKMLARLKPACLRDIMTAIALYRPGPAKFIDKYITNRRNNDHSGYKNPKLTKILYETYGCIVYSEQVAGIFRAVAGYSYGKADVVTRAIKKKKSDVIEKESKGFIEGAVKGGETPDAAKNLFDDMVGFANYGFKKSHAAAYAIVSYRTAYLKANYPDCYISALLSSVLGDLAKTSMYIEDAQRMGIELLPPDINSSEALFCPDGNGNIRYGLGALKNVSAVYIDNIVREREKRPFSGYVDFAMRMTEYDTSKKQIESLIKCGAFDSFGHTRCSLMMSYDKIFEMTSKGHRAAVSGQIDMFSDTTDTLTDAVVIKKPEYDEMLKLQFENEVSGIYFSGHPLDAYNAEIALYAPKTVAQIKSSEMTEGQSVNMCGIICAVTQKIVKNALMLFFTVADKTGECEVIVFSSVVPNYAAVIKKGTPVLVSGTVSVGEDNKIILKHCARLGERDMTKQPPAVPDKSKTPTPSAVPKPSVQTPAKAVPAAQSVKIPDSPRKMFLRFSSFNAPEFKRAIALCSIFTGHLDVMVYSRETNKYMSVKGVTAAATRFLVNELAELLGAENVVIN